MHKLLITCLILLSLTSILSAGIDWQYNIEDAMQEAKETDKYVFVFFTGSDWCVWCDRLKDEVFFHQQFENYVEDNMVMVMLDYPKANILSAQQKEYNSKKQKEYNIRGFPTVLILDTEGKVLVQTGYRPDGPEAYIEFLEEAINWKLNPSNATWIDDQGLIWQKNLENALEIAQDENKHVFIDFTGSDWCVWCHRLTDEIFSQPEFVDFVHENLVLVRFDFPKSFRLPAGEENYNQMMAQRFGVKGLPTLYLLDNTGKVKQKLGYQKGGAIPYTDMLRDLIQN